MRWLLYLYPRAWRSRYGDEFLALLEAQPRSLGMLFDIALAVLDAHLHLRDSAALASQGERALGELTKGERPLSVRSAAIAGSILAVLLFVAATAVEMLPLAVGALVATVYIGLAIWVLKILKEIKRLLANEWLS